MMRETHIYAFETVSSASAFNEELELVRNNLECTSINNILQSSKQ